MHNYYLANFLAGLAVAQERSQYEYVYPKITKFILANVKLLLKEGFIWGYEIRETDDKVNKSICVFLKYYESSRVPLIENIKILSTPGTKRFISYKSLLRTVKRRAPQGSSLYIVSTSQGLFTDIECIWYKYSGLLLYRIN